MTINVRFVGQRLDRYAAFVSVGGGAETKVSLDNWRTSKQWGCQECGRSSEPSCAHAALVDVANQLRKVQK